MLKPSLLALLFSTTAVTIVLNADQETTSFPVVESASPFPSKKQQDTPCSQTPNTMRVSARHIEAGGIGYQKGYTTVEGFFAPNPANWSYMPFLDLRGHVFNDGKFAANAGVGFRMMRGCRVYGINGYYDYRNTHRMHYNQISLGLETLGDFWDFRINGYLPVGDKKSDPFNTRFDHFTGNQIILSQKFQFSMKGADAEVGFHFGKTTNWDFWAAAGPYYFIGELGGPTWGGKARVGGSFRQYLTLEFLNSYDNTFHYRPQGQITLTWPFGPKAQKRKPNNSPCTLLTRMVQPVNRQEIVVVNRRHKDTPAINPATGDPYNVLFVDNTSSSAGTFESPYPTLAQAEAASVPGDIIYVFPGNGTTMGMDMGILLQPNQKFWGSGVSHTLATGQGTIVIPSQSASAPLITSLTGNGITLASGNDVSGFFITRPNRNGIFGADVTGITLSDTTIFAAQNFDGIHISENNDISNSLIFNNLTVINNANNGISVFTALSSDAQVVISNCNVSLNGLLGPSSMGPSNGIQLIASQISTMTVLLQNNVIQNNLNTGIVLDSLNDGALNYQIENNIIQGHPGGGISGIFSGTANVDVNLVGNTVIANDFVAADPNNSSNFFSFNGQSTLTATGNRFDENNNNGLAISAGTSAFNATITNNSMKGTHGVNNGFFLTAVDVEPITVLFENNDISLNGNGMSVFSFSGGNFNLTVNGNIAKGNCSSAISVQGAQIDTVFLTMNNNIFSENGSTAVFIFPDVINTLVVEANGNTMVGNCGSAISMVGFHINTALSVTANNNNFSNSLNSGMFINPASVPSYVVVANNNVFEGNGEAGLNLQSGIADAQFTINNNTFNNNMEGAVFVITSVDGAQNLNFDLENNVIFGSCAFGFDDTSAFGLSLTYNGTNTGTSDINVLNNNITYNDGNGIFLDITNGATNHSLGLDISNNTIAFNSQNGIDLIGNSSNILNVNSVLRGNNISYNELNGIAAVSENQTQFNLSAVGNTLFNNNAFGTSDMSVSNTSASSFMCLSMEGNTSNVGYSLSQTAGNFYLAPNGVSGAQAVNVGTISTTGTITPTVGCPPS